MPKIKNSPPHEMCKISIFKKNILRKFSYPFKGGSESPYTYLKEGPQIPTDRAEKRANDSDFSDRLASLKSQHEDRWRK